MTATIPRSEHPRPEHPRPDRRRDRWQILNGRWGFSFDVPDFDRRIVVPFAYQCEASGIAASEPHETLWYRRRFRVPERVDGERVLLHFGAVDFDATVWVDGTEVGSHRGGHTSFAFDITDALGSLGSVGSVGSLPGGAGDVDDHEVVVRVVDEYRSDQLRGKQTATFPFMVHYTPTSGIWQPVWIEVTGAGWIEELHVVAGADGDFTATAAIRSSHDGIEVAGVRVTLDVDGDVVVLEVVDPAVDSVTASVTGTVAGVRPWSPEDPALYALRAELVGADGAVLDTIHGHVGFRTLAIEGDRWFLNGEPLYQRLLLDQGYWPPSLITPPTDEAMVADLRFVKECGCNGVRKHQKIEDPRFLWHADRLGVLVWEELPSPFGMARVRGALAETASAEWAEAVRRDRSHPSVIAWVPFNESWGIQGVHQRHEHQETVRRFVAETRALDPTRAVVDNSGWGHVETDVVDVHDYDQDPESLVARWSGIEARGWNRGPMALADEVPDFDFERWCEFAQVPDPRAVDRNELFEMLPNVTVWADGCMPAPGTSGPLIISEFGGVGLDLDGATGSTGSIGERFDYAGATDADDLLERFAAQVRAIESIPEVRGWCWTELSDVEQEINGLLTADRRPKIDPARLCAAIGDPPDQR